MLKKILVFATLVVGLSACHHGHDITGPKEGDDPPPVTSTPNKTPKYKVGDALSIQPADNSEFMSVCSSNGNAGWVDWRQVQFLVGNAGPVKFARTQAAPPGFNRCAISPNGKVGVFQDTENREKLCNLSSLGCTSMRILNDASRVRAVYASDSTVGISDGAGGVIFAKHSSGGNMLSTPVVLVQFTEEYGLVNSITAIEGGKFLVLVTDAGCYDVRNNDGKYQRTSQVLCGSVIKGNQPAMFAWDDKSSRMYGAVDGSYVMFSSSNGQLTQLGAGHQFGGPLYMPTILAGDLFVNTKPGVVEMFTAASPEWDKPTETYVFQNPDYYVMGAIQCPGSQNVCLTTLRTVYPLVLQK